MDKVCSLTTGWTLDTFAGVVSRFSGESVSRITVANWQRGGILRPILPGKGRKRGLVYGPADLLTMILRARLIAEGVSPSRVKKSLALLRDLAPDLLDQRKTSGHRLIVTGRRVFLADESGSLEQLPDRQLCLVFDPAAEIAIVRKAERELARAAA